MKFYNDDKVTAKPGTTLILTADPFYKMQLAPQLVGEPAQLAEIENVAFVSSKDRSLGTCRYSGDSGQYSVTKTAYDVEIRVVNRRTRKPVKTHVLRAKGSPQCKTTTTKDDMYGGSSVYVENADIVAWVRDNVR